MYRTKVGSLRGPTILKKITAQGCQLYGLMLLLHGKEMKYHFLFYRTRSYGWELVLSRTISLFVSAETIVDYKAEVMLADFV